MLGTSRGCNLCQGLLGHHPQDTTRRQRQKVSTKNHVYIPPFTRETRPQRQVVALGTGGEHRLGMAAGQGVEGHPDFLFPRAIPGQLTPGQLRQSTGTLPHVCSTKCGPRQPSGQTGNSKMLAWISWARSDWESGTAWEAASLSLLLRFLLVFRL